MRKKKTVGAFENPTTHSGSGRIDGWAVPLRYCGGRFPGQWETGLGLRCCVGRTRRGLTSHRRSNGIIWSLTWIRPSLAAAPPSVIVLTKMPSFSSPASAPTPTPMMLRPILPILWSIQRGKCPSSQHVFPARDRPRRPLGRHLRCVGRSCWRKTCCTLDGNINSCSGEGEGGGSAG